MSMCPFCAKSVDDKPIRQNKLAQVFLSNPHKVPGHVLVMPKRHVEMPWQMTPEEVKACFELIFLIEKRFMGKLGEGFDIRQSFWPFRGQADIKQTHVLFHVIPRSEDDYLFKLSEGKDLQDLYADLDEVEGDAVARLLSHDDDHDDDSRDEVEMPPRA